MSRSLMLCTALAGAAFISMPAFAQSAPWDAPAAPATDAAPATATEAAAPAPAAELVPGWIATVHARNGESTLEILPDAVLSYVTPNSSFSTVSHLDKLGVANLFLPAVYEHQGLLNVTKAGTYSFVLNTDAVLEKRAGTQVLKCGISLSINDTQVIPPQDVLLDQKKGDNYTGSYRLTTSAPIALAEGTYPVTWLTGCRPDAGVTYEAGVYQEPASKTRHDIEKVAVNASLLMQEEGGTPVAITGSMIMHDKNSAPPLKDPPLKAEALQAGMVRGWKVSTFAPQEKAQDYPSGSAVGSGLVASPTLNTMGMKAIAGGEQLPDFEATSNFLAREDGAYTFMLMGTTIGRANGKRANCHMALDMGDHTKLIEGNYVMDKDGAMGLTGHVDLAKGAYPVKLTVSCQKIERISDDRALQVELLVKRPGAMRVSPAADLVTEK